MLLRFARNFYLHLMGFVISVISPHNSTEKRGLLAYFMLEVRTKFLLALDRFRCLSAWHPRLFPTYVLHVLHSFDCETYLVDLDDVKNFLTEEQVNSFEQNLLEKAESLLQLENEDLDDFRELSKDEKLTEVGYYISDECLLLELFKAYDEDLYNDYLKDISLALH